MVRTKEAEVLNVIAAFAHELIETIDEGFVTVKCTSKEVFDALPMTITVGGTDYTAPIWYKKSGWAMYVLPEGW